MLNNALLFLASAVIAVPLCRYLGLGSVIGYLAAGVFIGPWGLAVVDDVEYTLHFSEIGVVLLLFIIGLELRPSRLWALRRSIFGFGALQMGLTTLILGTCFYFMGQDLPGAGLTAIVLALSSTAFALQLMAEQKELSTRMGRTAFANLLFQDLAVIPLLAIIPLLAKNDGTTGFDVSGALLPIGVLLAVALGGRFVLRQAMRTVVLADVREVVTAMALLIVLGMAWLMEQVGLSMALGAFIAGVLLADSEFRHQLEADIVPFKGLLLGLFFIAVGMSLNLGLLASNTIEILLLVVGLVGVKATVLYILGRWKGLGHAESLRLGLVLSQGGEFAFVIFGIAVTTGLIATNFSDKLIVVITLSMMTTPMLLALQSRFTKGVTGEKPEYDAMPNDEPPVLIAGFGRFGQITARILQARGIPFTALDRSQSQVDFLRLFGNEIYYGDAERLDLLEAAGAAEARILVLAVDDAESALRIVTLVKQHFPQIKIYARARNRKHAYRLMDLEVDVIQRETFLSALDFAHQVLLGLGVSSAEASKAVDTFRQHDLKRLHAHRHLHNDEEKMHDLAKTAAAELQEMFEKDAKECVEQSH